MTPATGQVVVFVLIAYRPMKRFFQIFALLISLTLTFTSPAKGESLPASAEIPGVSGHAQGYSLSCESRSAVDLAAFWGISIGETEFLQALPRAENPEEGFVGDPNDTWGNIPPQGYGVHAGPVADTLQEFGLVVEAQHDLSWDDLREEINAGHPVIVWVIGQMWDGKSIEYEAPDGSTSTVAAFEHTMLLTGYSPDSVQVVDAYSGAYQIYPLKTFQRSWAVLGNMAVFGFRETSNQDDSVEPALSGDSYTVQYGDYLTKLAESFGTTWQELAELNSIGYPFTIFPGQLLKIPGGEEPATVAEILPEVEPEAVNPQSNPAMIGFQVHLPMVQHDFSAVSGSTQQTAPGTAEHNELVIVRSFNTLAGFCKSIGVDWHPLAKLNDLQTPYLVYPGQALRLR